MPDEKDGDEISLGRARSDRSLSRGSGFMVRRARELAQTAGVLNLADDIEVVFPDKHLEAEVRDALGKPEGPLTKGDLKWLDALDASETEVRHLSGIEHAVNLTDLYIMDTPISDISPLALLTKLTTLMLGGNDISDVGPLASLTHLTDLMLGGNDINNIGPLTSLTNLTYLNLSGNDISYIGPLASLTNLTKLSLSHTDVSDISTLASITNLAKLYLYGTPLNQESIDVHVSALESKGVDVSL